MTLKNSLSLIGKAWGFVWFVIIFGGIALSFFGYNTTYHLTYAPL